MFVFMGFKKDLMYATA